MLVQRWPKPDILIRTFVQLFERDTVSTIFNSTPLFQGSGLHGSWARTQIQLSSAVKTATMWRIMDTDHLSVRLLQPDNTKFLFITIFHHPLAEAKRAHPLLVHFVTLQSRDCQTSVLDPQWLKKEVVSKNISVLVDSSVFLLHVFLPNTEF